MCTSDDRSNRRNAVVYELRQAIPNFSTEDWSWHAIERLKQLDNQDLIVMTAKFIYGDYKELE